MSATDKTVIRDTLIHEEKRDRDAASVSSSESDLSEKKKTGIVQSMKDGVKKVVDALAGKDDRHEATCNSTTCATFTQETAHYEEVDDHARNARLLREQANATLKKNTQEFAEAATAQRQAHILAEHANIKTAEALEHQQVGQQLLAEAGMFCDISIPSNQSFLIQVLK